MPMDQAPVKPHGPPGSSETEFRPGHCAQSVLAAVTILVHYLDDGEYMDIHVARSYGRFIHDWLKDAALTLPE